MTVLNKEWIEAEKARISNQMPKSKGSNDLKWAKPPLLKGIKFKFRILPPVDDDPLAVMQFRHYNIDSDGSVMCMKTYGEDCEICKLVDANQNELRDKYSSSGQAYFNAIIDYKDYPPEVSHILGMSAYFYQWLLEQMSDPDQEEYMNLFDPKLGRNLMVKRKFDKGAFERTILPASKPIALTDEKIAEILGTRAKLSTIFGKINDEKAGRHYQAIETLKEKLEVLKGPATESAPESPLPSCFSDPKVYSEKSKKCKICPFKPPCEVALKDIPF